MYSEKLMSYFKKKNLKQNEVAELLGYSPTMIGRYLKGSDAFKPDFLEKLVKHFPDIDLQYIFTEDSTTDNVASEPQAAYKKEEDIIDELELIQEKIEDIKKYLAQKSHQK